ncbi:class I SAM-dependent methyltransferase [Streptomyces sp. ISL-10]|uniref:methyltransferase domain-containing protein n=1 Tax=Streptomyces sp. ISL-10 TaxID=2819172 RepID=UPI001BE741E4|nr:class I SAM-dependent methyltransferase [Streptomyces sp. ISL-10]MBT2370288.1 class I SAM-dependent methyltransferase [Streptomyces sp. ISL-10]
MSGTDAARYAPEWLALREGADAAARSPELLAPLRRQLALSARATDPPERGEALVIRDLGCGTGAMGRWLAPRLNGPQHWILHDRDPDLLELAAARMPRTAAGGSRVTVTSERGDITHLTADGLCGTSLVTASALLDLLTRDELDALAAACAGAGCPALLALSVVGRVDLTPDDPLDAEIAEAFNSHQRREDQGRRLLGPDAVAAASVSFARHGMTVRAHNSPWRLGHGPPVPPGGQDRPAPGDDGSALMAEWLHGWVDAAVEQSPELAPRAHAYLRRRLAACEEGELRVVVHHSDILALPCPTGDAS